MAVRLASQMELDGPLKGYRLIDRLGRGGFGEVWKVEAPGGLMKAMKFVFGDLDSTDDDDGRPAEQELKALNRVKSIRHPYILSLERIDRIDGQLIIVMELADRNLWDRFKECRSMGMPGIPREELLRYMEEAAEALDLMNKHYHIQHLDVKPQNLFLVFNHLKVADFGLAKAFEGDRGTVTGGVTPVYAAPETFEGYASQYTDQYSLAIVFQELLTGTRPFNGSNTKQLLMQHLNGIPDLSPLPPTDRPIIARSLSKKPDERFESCTELLKQLRFAGTVTFPVAVETDTPVKKSSSGLGKISPNRNMSEVNSDEQITRFTQNATGRPSQALNTPAGNITRTPRAASPSGVNGPMPKLVTPKKSGGPKVFQSQLVTRSNRSVSEPMQTIPMVGSSGLDHKERTGEGLLFPAMYVGIGQFGLRMLQRVREEIRATFRTDPPHVQYLFIDTDPDMIQQALSEPCNFPNTSVHFAKLQRPAHYLQQSQLPNVEQWLPPGMLYRLPKTPNNAAGVRSFARLALLDNYKPIAAKIQAAINATLDTTGLENIARVSGLGLRSTRPRVYFLTNLAGGTGSGMVLDVAYLTRHLFREAGCSQVETVGILLVPPADTTMPLTPALANTYAACRELSQYSNGHPYSTRFAANESPVQDDKAPFKHCTILQTSPRFDEDDQRRIFGMIATQLNWELSTPLGRLMDQVRQEASSLPREPGPIVQSFGLFRMVWPRQGILRASVTRFASTMMKRWTMKEAAHLVEPIRNWLTEQWTNRHMEVAEVIELLNDSVKTQLKESSDVVFDAIIMPLNNKGQTATRVDAVAACQALDQILKLVGKPPAENDPDGSLAKTLKDASKQFITKADKHFATLAVSFVEQPQYRLAGADEALTQIAKRLKVSIDGLVGVRTPLSREVSIAFARIFQIIGALNSNSTMANFGSRKSTLSQELVDNLREYPKKRLQLLVLDTALGIYRSLQGSLPEYVSDVQMCRTRLDKVIEDFDNQPSVNKQAEPYERYLLPPGCKTLGDVADEFIAALSPEDILGFDQRLQDEVQDRYQALVKVCMKPETTADFVELFKEKALAFLSPRLETSSAAELFFRYLADDPQTNEQMDIAFDNAGPDLTTISGKAPAEATILAVPPGPVGEQLREFITQQLKGIEFIPSELPDEVAILREYPLLPLAGIPQLAEHARKAYQTCPYHPHSRVDGPWTNKKS